MKIKVTNSFGFNELQILVLGFFVLIMIGATLLSMPISSKSGQWTQFVDCVFISTSATCVTGLVTLDTGTHWSYFGQTVILMLIEVGGLGFMSMATLIALLLGRKITLEERILMQESLNFFKLQGIVKLFKYVLIFTFIVQATAAAILSTQFIPEFGVGKGIYYGVFHAISAFCNAGIDLMGGFSSLTSYAENPIIILTVSLLIVIGGLGFYVWREIYEFRIGKKLSLHSRIVIWTTLILIVLGAVLMYLFEMDNVNTIKNMSFKGKVLSSIFASITPRTAGFNSISTNDMSAGGKLLTIILMFIGGSPGSTAGGIKTTTLALLVMTVVCVVRGRHDTEIYQKRIAKELVYRALALTIISISIVIFVTMILCITEKGASLEAIVYETVSAFGTVGLTLGHTTKLSTVGKIILSITMYFGRLGPLTVALALAKKKIPNSIQYPEDKILIG